MDREKHVDESWKDAVSGEKEILAGGDHDHKEGDGCGCGHSHEHAEGEEPSDSMEINFINYISSLAFQALIFLGELPNPLDDSKMEKNLPQAKFLIDTLIMIREKTKGNLTPEEDNLISATVYELQTKFVDLLKKENS
ncbi:MAG: DUF1844 domain-containing protein [Candidatus Omnitrophica bacterium]|nr:DUF1844 domain-containing protein [Candidatus Omnitrophota bacterium]